MKHGKDNDLETYYIIFKNILNNLKIKELILKIKCMKFFLKELPVQARKKAIRKISVNFKKLKTMKFDAIYIFIIKKAQKVKRQNIIKELVNKKIVRELIQQQKVSLKSNHIVIRINSTLPSGLRRFPGLEEERKEMRFAKKETLKNISNNDKNDKIDVLTKQMKSLILVMNSIRQEQNALAQNRQGTAQ